MKIAVIGAGALGGVYAVRLAAVADVTLVASGGHRVPSAISIERISGGSGAIVQSWDTPVTSDLVPVDAEVVIVAVRVDQLSHELATSLAHQGPDSRIVVVLTPMLPDTHARMESLLGDRLVSAMPGVVSYAPESSSTSQDSLYLRYWTPASSPTTLDPKSSDPAHAATVARFVETLRAAQFPVALDPTVAGTDAALCIASLPLVLSIEIAGSIDALLADRKLLSLGLDATKEARALAKTVGALPGFASFVLGFSTPLLVRSGIALARSRNAEVMHYVDMHFARKLSAQNRALAKESLALFGARGLGCRAFAALEERAARR